MPRRSSLLQLFLLVGAAVAEGHSKSCGDTGAAESASQHFEETTCPYFDAERQAFRVVDELTLLQGKKAVAKPPVQQLIQDSDVPARASSPVDSWRASFAELIAGDQLGLIKIQHTKLEIGFVLVVVAFAVLLTQRYYPGSNVMAAASVGFGYICVSACMIESNKWLMLPGHFPYPLTLTTNHMLMSWLLANLLRVCCPSAFPALQKIEVTWWFCAKFVPIGAAFALSIVCGNAAYQYLSVSFLQMMKQSNIVVIYTLSVLAGLEALRRCSVILLLGTLCGTMMAIHGELHFMLTGFLLQLVSTLSEAVKVITQGILMSGSYKLDPMTMVLFMAPSCLLANLIPSILHESPRIEEIFGQFKMHLPLILINACLAFCLNLLVAQCIKQLSPVGYLLCGIVKDVCIIVSSTWLLGDSLTRQQVVGFSMALVGVASYSLYKQNQDCFEDDHLRGFLKVAQRLFQKVPAKMPELQTAVTKADQSKETIVFTENLKEADS